MHVLEIRLFIFRVMEHFAQYKFIHEIHKRLGHRPHVPSIHRIHIRYFTKLFELIDDPKTSSTNNISDDPDEYEKDEHLLVALHISARFFPWLYRESGCKIPEKEALDMTHRYLEVLQIVSPSLFDSHILDDVKAIGMFAESLNTTGFKTSQHIYESYIVLGIHGVASHLNFSRTLHRIMILTFALADIYLDGGVDAMNDFSSGFIGVANKVPLEMNPITLQLIGAHPTKSFSQTLSDYADNSTKNLKIKTRFVPPEKTWDLCAMLITIHYHRRRQLKLTRHSRTYEFVDVFCSRYHMEDVDTDELEVEECIHPFQYDADTKEFYYVPYIPVDSERQIQDLIAHYIRYQVVEHVPDEIVEKFNMNGAPEDGKKDNEILLDTVGKGALKHFDILIK